MKFKKITILGLSLLTFGLALTSCNLGNEDENVQTLPPITENANPSGDNVTPDVEKVTLTVMTGSSSKKYEFLKGASVKVSELAGLKKSNYTIEGFYYDVSMTEKIETEFEITGNLKIYVKYELVDDYTSNEDNPTTKPIETTPGDDNTPTTNTPEVTEKTFDYTVSYSYKIEGETATHLYTEKLQLQAQTNKTAMEYYEAEADTAKESFVEQIKTNYNAVDKKVTNVTVLEVELYVPAGYITFSIEGTNKVFAVPSGTKWNEFLYSSQTTLGKDTGFSISRDEEVLYVTPNSMYIKDDTGKCPEMFDEIKPITYTISGASEATTLSTDFWKEGAIVSVKAYDYETNQELPNQYDPFYSEEKTLCIDTSWLRDFYEDNGYKDFYLIVKFDKVYSFGMCTWYTSISDTDYTLYVDDEETNYLHYNTHMGVTATGTDTDDLNNTRFNKLRIDISPQSGYISSGTISMKTNN